MADWMFNRRHRKLSR